MRYGHLDEHLRTSARLHPHSTAYTFAGSHTTYAELDQHVSNVSAFLQAQGLGHGDGIALILPNSGAFVTLYHGALRLGMYCVPINPLYTQQELVYLLRDSEVKAIAAPAQMAKMAVDILTQWPGMKLIVVGEGSDGLPAGVASYTDIVSTSHTDSLASDPALDADDVAVILYTSGTTGKPKGAVLTHNNLAANAAAVGNYMQFAEEDLVLAVLPMFHVFSLTVCLNAVIYRAAHVVIHPRFSPSDALKTMEEARVTIFVGVPTMYHFLLQVAGDKVYDLHALRFCISGGAPLPLALQEAFERRFGVEVLEGYGLSEASPVTNFATVDGRSRKAGSVGLSLPDVEEKIVDLSDQEVSRGTVGELVVRGPNVMQRYWRRPEETALVLRGGWLHTGDLATMDDEGYVFIVDRMKDMIIVGGFNVYPREVEEVLFRHVGVAEAAVVGMPDEVHGEMIVACVVPKDPGGLRVEDLLEHCHENLAKYKCPTKLVLLDQLPKNSTGKVLRRVLREQMKN